MTDWLEQKGAAVLTEAAPAETRERGPLGEMGLYGHVRKNGAVFGQQSVSGDPQCRAMSPSYRWKYLRVIARFAVGLIGFTTPENS